MTFSPIPDPRHQVILFPTRWGKYLITRAEREKLARLHGAGALHARALAFEDAELPEGPVAARVIGTYSAHHLARLFDGNGDPRPGVSPIPGMYPALPRAAGGGRAGA